MVTNWPVKELYVRYILSTQPASYNQQFALWFQFFNFFCADHQQTSNLKQQHSARYYSLIVHFQANFTIKSSQVDYDLSIIVIISFHLIWFDAFYVILLLEDSPLYNLCFTIVKKHPPAPLPQRLTILAQFLLKLILMCV